MRFKDKVVIVTGAARGIGLACSQAFAAEGATVVMADIDEEKGPAAAAAVVAATGAKARFSKCDVGSRGQANGLAEATVQAFGGIDVLVNNAGITHNADFLDLDEVDFDRVLRINLKGSFLMGQAVAKRMVATGRTGSIINMSSISSVLAVPRQVPYALSKGGVNQLTKVMAVGLAPYGIRVNGVAPGSIKSGALERVMADEATRTVILSRTPLGRAGTPEEVARVVLFLAGDEAAYMTGQTLYPDGGRLALNYTLPVTSQL